MTQMSGTLFEFRMRYPGFKPDAMVEDSEGRRLVCTSHPYEEDGHVKILAKGRIRRFDPESVDAYRISGPNPELFAMAMSAHQRKVENNKLLRSVDP